MRELIAEHEWLTAFLPPAYSADLNPVEGDMGARQTQSGQPRRGRPRPARSPRPKPLQTTSVPAQHPRRLHSGHRPALRQSDVSPAESSSPSAGSSVHGSATTVTRSVLI
ncbi:hypothetical protein [Streptomyces sp. LUP30]|uniref:hypothetical protein n=1 Tax=Streptomyces sp. LUP30 TaxID=1890285 RepID=UPI002108A970|nr:hypothetical protein [Streptomyces sp. LUP30]